LREFQLVNPHFRTAPPFPIFVFQHRATPMASVATTIRFKFLEAYKSGITCRRIEALARLEESSTHDGFDRWRQGVGYGHFYEESRHGR
jgi:hypothetical protein